MLIGPRGNPVCTGLLCIAIVRDLISEDTGNAGFIVLSEASANPDLMIDWLVQREKRIPVFDSRFQRFSFPTIDAIRETLHENRSLALQCDDPYVVTIAIVIYTLDVTRRFLHGEACHYRFYRRAP